MVWKCQHACSASLSRRETCPGLGAANETRPCSQREREEKLFALPSPPQAPRPCGKGAERGQERGWDREERKDFELRASLNLESCKCLKWSPGLPSGGAMGTMREPAGPA